MNRAQRRAAAREALAVPEWKKRELKEKMAAAERLAQGGITPKDLQAAYDKGFNEGFHAAAHPIIKGIYAGVCLALNEKHGFGAKRCGDILKLVDEKVLYSLDGQDLIDEVLARMGVTLNFEDPFCRVETEG